MDVLQDWLWKNFEDPYPPEQVREELAEKSGQVNAKQVRIAFPSCPRCLILCGKAHVPSPRVCAVGSPR